jgi:GntR family transcriptional regulator of vanillate catabolism
MKTRSALEELQRRLLAGEFPPGTHLEEEILADMLGISRTPVRTALGLLAQEGLLDYAPKRGFRVRYHGAKDIGDAWEVRAVLESTACRIVASRGMERAALAALSDYLTPVDVLFASNNPGEKELLAAYREMNVQFHNGILRATDNNILTDFVARLCKMPVSVGGVENFYELPTARGMEFLFDLAWLRRSHDDHHRIVAAIAERDGRRAEYLMFEHVQAAARYIVGRDRADRPPAKLT